MDMDLNKYNHRKNIAIVSYYSVRSTTLLKQVFKTLLENCNFVILPFLKRGCF